MQRVSLSAMCAVLESERALITIMSTFYSAAGTGYVFSSIGAANRIRVQRRVCGYDAHYGSQSPYGDGRGADQCFRRVDTVTTLSLRPLPQFVRYILVGGFNTLFGYFIFALLNWLFSSFSSYSYLYAAVPGNVIAITVAFLGYKWFVFRTRGNYFIEWIRCVGVYGSSMLIGLLGLAIFVPILRHHLHNPQLAPYLVGAMMTAVGVIISFLGHKNISFREKISDDTTGDRTDSRTD